MTDTERLEAVRRELRKVRTRLENKASDASVSTARASNHADRLFDSGTSSAFYVALAQLGDVERLLEV